MALQKLRLQMEFGVHDNLIYLFKIGLYQPNLLDLIL